MPLSEHLFIILMFTSVKSQSRYKRSAYVSLSSSFSTCPFQYITVSQWVTGTQPHGQPARRLHAPKWRVSQLRTGLDKCYTPHFHCKSTTSKRKTLLRLTETELISFDPAMPTILELQPTLRHFSHAFSTNFVVPTHNYHSTDHGWE